MGSDNDAVVQALGEMFAQADRHAADSLALYRYLNETGLLDQHLIFEARCRRRCLLLHVFQTPAGPAFYIPRYKLSPELNESLSNPAGRAANTEDGDHRWREQCSLTRHAANFTLTCDHYRGILELEDIAGTPGHAVRRTLPPA